MPLADKPNSPGIALEGVSKKYGDGPAANTVIENLSLDVTAGDFVSLMGPSGCGKTTLLNLIAGIDEPSTGRVVVNGHDLARLSERERGLLRLRSLSLVFQNFNLLPRITVRRNVAWRLGLIGIHGREAAERTAKALLAAGVPEPAWGRFPAELSGGEQQRAAIARALVTDPKILLADEPTGSLDSVTGNSILNELRQLNREREMTLIVVTHDPHVGACARRIIELRDGRVVRDLEGGAHDSAKPAEVVPIRPRQG